MKKITVISVLFAIILSIGAFSTCKPKNQLTKQTEGIIRGFVYADVSIENKNIEHVFLPDVTVTVKNESGAVVDEVQSRLDGDYATKHLKMGKYKVCLSKNGFILSCYDAIVQYATNHPGPLKLNYNTEKFIWGTAKLKDGRSGFYNQQVFGISFDTKIIVTNTDSSIQTRCNMYGYYLIPNIDTKQKGIIKATCENSQISAAFSGQRRIDLVFNNSNPKINFIFANNEDGKTIRRTRPGKKITLRANVTDEENNSLHYKWIPFGNFPGFVSQDAPEVTWELPAKTGSYEMDLMIVDNFGGVAYKSYSIISGDGSVNFSGIVSNADGSGRISDALIKVNGNFSTTSDANGYFSFKVPENDNERYVLNVIKPGYSLCSKIYMNDAIQKEYKLISATTETFDPTNDIIITEKSDKYTKFGKDSFNSRGPANLMIPKNSI